MQRLDLLGGLARTMYAENRQQGEAFLFVDPTRSGDSLGMHQIRQIAGNPGGFVTTKDVDRAQRTIVGIAAAFKLNTGQVPKIAIAVKHGNACGCAIGDHELVVLQRLIDCDRTSILGAVVATNFPFSIGEAHTLLTYGREEGKRALFACVFAPWFSKEAKVALDWRKSHRCWVISNPELYKLSQRSVDTGLLVTSVRAGWLVQPNHTQILDLNHPSIEKIGSLTTQQEHDMLMAVEICRTSNSNTITACRNGVLVVNAVGQQSRVRCCRLAMMIAKECGTNLKDAVVASDSFFPVNDAPQVLRKAGVTAIFATSGSENDNRLRTYVRRCGIPTYLIPDTQGRMFFGH